MYDSCSAYEWMSSLIMALETERSTTSADRSFSSGGSARKSFALNSQRQWRLRSERPLNFCCAYLFATGVMDARRNAQEFPRLYFPFCILKKFSAARALPCKLFFFSVLRPYPLKTTKEKKFQPAIDPCDEGCLYSRP